MKTAAKKKFILEGLCCPQCAAQIEREIGKLEGISRTAVDLISKTLTIEFAAQEKMDTLVDKADSIIKQLDPGIAIREKAYTGIPARAKTAGPDRKEILFWVSQCIGITLFLIALIAAFEPPIPFILFLISYLLIGGEVVFRAIKNITRGEVFDENFLMSVATIGAFAIGEYPEGAAVMLFYQIGETFQRVAVNRSRSSIAALMDIRPDFAHVKRGGAIVTVGPEEVSLGEPIVVKPGEKVPLDGRVIEGVSALDTSALTGEALPRDVEPGSEVLSGSINKNGLLVIEVTKLFGESTVAKILDLVQNAGSKKAPVENFITKFARYYTPAVVFSALALAVVPPLLVPGAGFAQWINRALVFLVVSCPCALVISIPLSFFGGIGGASRKGILVKGSNYLDALHRVDTVVFDKTGTLTKGIFKVTRIVAMDPWKEEELLDYAAHAENFSNHPIALSIRQAYQKSIDTQKIEAHEELAGLGIRVRINGKTVLAGNGKLLDRERIEYPKPDLPGTAVYLVIDRILAGYLVISDEVKPDSKEGIRRLKALGVHHIAMLTGDTRLAGEAVARELGVDSVYTELLPHEKVRQLEQLESAKSGTGTLLFVGDGINDAPVLVRSDVGIAMGGAGSDAAIEAADVVLMTDEPSKLVTAIQIARKTHRIVWENIIFALGVKAGILIMGALGIATIWAAVFGDVGVAVIAILNAMRAMQVKTTGYTDYSKG
ncbi:MAG: cadmium-translocating P-type ATPase [Treponema sp.]|jgi:Cd2+/Zn2+-exporting ATPase|nr:cadmium-translocating P-type ATPase [Treponema sp.]